MKKTIILNANGSTTKDYYTLFLHFEYVKRHLKEKYFEIIDANYQAISYLIKEHLKFENNKQTYDRMINDINKTIDLFMLFHFMKITYYNYPLSNLDYFEELKIFSNHKYSDMLFHIANCICSKEAKFFNNEVHKNDFDDQVEKCYNLLISKKEKLQNFDASISSIFLYNLNSLLSLSLKFGVYMCQFYYSPMVDLEKFLNQKENEVNFFPFLSFSLIEKLNNISITIDYEKAFSTLGKFPDNYSFNIDNKLSNEKANEEINKIRSIYSFYVEHIESVDEFISDLFCEKVLFRYSKNEYHNKILGLIFYDYIHNNKSENLKQIMYLLCEKKIFFALKDDTNCNYYICKKCPNESSCFRGIEKIYKKTAKCIQFAKLI